MVFSQIDPNLLVLSLSVSSLADYVVEGVSEANAREVTKQRLDLAKEKLSDTIKMGV